MKIRLISIGKMKNAELRALAKDYADRVSHFASLEIVEVRDGKSSDATTRLHEEAQALRLILGKKNAVTFPHAILWDERGKILDTKEFSVLVDRTPMVDFVIGSSHGIDAELKREIPKHLRLSSFTLTHEWARALALEQLYRAFCVLRGFPYHH